MLCGIFSLLAISVVAVTGAPAEECAADIVAVTIIDSFAAAISKFNIQVYTFNEGLNPDGQALEALVNRGVSQIERSPRILFRNVDNVKSHVDYLGRSVTELLSTLDLERQVILNLGRPVIKGWVDSTYRGSVMVSVAIANKAELVTKIMTKLPGELQDTFWTLNRAVWQILEDAQYTWNQGERACIVRASDAYKSWNV